MVRIFTDGSAFNNGLTKSTGWAFVVTDSEDITISDSTQFFCGGSTEGTNNSAELEAVLNAMMWAYENTAEGVDIAIYTDSKYAEKVCGTWIYIWANHGWKNKQGESISYPELSKRIYDLAHKISFTVQWMPGHGDNPFNNFADSLANKMALRFQGKEFALFQDVDLGDKLSIRGQSYKVTAKFISSGTIVLNPLFNKKLKTVILNAEEFDNQEYIAL